MTYRILTLRNNGFWALIVALILLLTAACFLNVKNASALSSYQIGDTTYYSDGSKTFTIGDTIYYRDSDGNKGTIYEIGDTTYYRDSSGNKTTSYEIGDTTYYRDINGNRATSYDIGDTTYVRDVYGNKGTIYKVGGTTYYKGDIFEDDSTLYGGFIPRHQVTPSSNIYLPQRDVSATQPTTLARYKCNGKMWTSCPDGTAFYCTTDGGAECIPNPATHAEISSRDSSESGKETSKVACERRLFGALTFFGFLTEEDCYATWQNAVEARQEQEATVDPTYAAIRGSVDPAGNGHQNQEATRNAMSAAVSDSIVQSEKEASSSGEMSTVTSSSAVERYWWSWLLDLLQFWVDVLHF